MAKKPAQKDDKKKKVRAKHRHDIRQPKVKKSGGNALGGFFRFLVSPWLRRFILLAALVALLFWQWDNISGWFVDVTENTIGMLGWGLILIALAILIIIGYIFRRQISDFVVRWKLYQWNKWLGAAALMFAVWGVLALFELGGSFGQMLVGDSLVIGILRVLGLFLLGLILVMPGVCWRGVKAFFGWLAGLFKPLPPPVRTGREEMRPPVQPPIFSHRERLKNRPRR